MSHQRPIKVLHLVWNLIRGGTEGQCARVAMELARRGDVHRVMVFRREGFFLSQVEEVCGPVEEIGIQSMVSLRTYRSVRRLARMLRRENYDLLHTWDADAAIFGQFAASMADIPLITSRRDLGQIYPPHKVRLLARADQQAVKVVANAQAIARHFGNLRPFRIIPNILDAAEFDLLAEKPFPTDPGMTVKGCVAMVTRLDPEKDVSTFLFAADRVLREHPEALFVVAGDGVERGRLVQLAHLRGLRDRFHLLGERTDIPGLLRQASIGVLTPSRNEGLSNTILEYMTAGLPVVATDCGGNRELIEPQRGGSIVDAGDEEALAREILNLLRKPVLRKEMGERNRQRILANHQPGPVGDQFEALYRDVIQPEDV
ncbi:MAG: glycosyltransferase [Kiritimatiellae bacterium]|nr:glycosyltransferase [Kiritimatiellia bacterium]